jgi:hypothetical protein
MKHAEKWGDMVNRDSVRSATPMGPPWNSQSGSRWVDPFIECVSELVLIVITEKFGVPGLARTVSECRLIRLINISIPLIFQKSIHQRR